MMRVRLLGFGLLVVVGLMSCKEQKSVDAEVQGMADLECRAIELRKERFKLADNIRFAQDSLIHTKSHTDSVRIAQELDAFTKHKQELLDSSNQLADSIKQQLDSLQKFILQKEEDKTFFNQKLSTELHNRGCE